MLPPSNPKTAPATSTSINGQVPGVRALHVPPERPPPNSLTVHHMSTHTIIEVGIQIAS